MKLIAHRGNIEGPDTLKENHPNFIDAAMAIGFDVEIDIRLIDRKFYLGHDDPQYHVPMTWLVERKDNLWIHCKNLESLQNLISSPVDFNCFWHQTDDFTLTSKKYIWTYPGKKYNYKSVIVMPELNVSLENFSEILKYDCFGICSDYVGRLV
jgi:hypothetical protein